ncbi:hypothetical protein KI688_007222 [Linnemannia hyalina]|uniref:Uncharacterized protein n=1 Tax=Linnemannia hyalina TaxID=64524 RepID=A0A9P7XIB2_9FUNG|nr:hypothetical protein KI688_007222 [Linnemannia hyalina]
MSRPEYLGNLKHLPPTVDTKSYFLETAVAEWDLAGFLLSGQNKDIFLRGLQGLVDIKAISRDVRSFAKALRVFYSVEQNVIIAMNRAQELLNRRALKGFEHRVVQNELQTSLINVLNNLPDPLAENGVASSSSTRTSSSGLTRKRSAARTPQPSNKKRNDVEGGLDSDETAVEGLKATKGMGDKAVAGNNHDDEDEEDGGGEETVEGLIHESQELEKSELAAQKGEVLEKVSSGHSLTLEDLSPCRRSASIGGDDDYPQGITPPIYSPRDLLGSDLPSSDPADMSFVDQGDINLSTSRWLTWNFLEGPGRVDSDVESHWVYNGIEVGYDLMACRNRIVGNNGGLTEPYEKLAVNFVFLVGAEYQTGGLQGEIEDQTWDSLCDAVRDPVLPLSDEAAIEALRWAHRLAHNKSEGFAQLLDDSPPQNLTLKSILTKMSDTTQLWNTQRRNEDTYLKCQLGPFLDTYFGKLRHTKSDWTPTQDDTKGSESNLLIPDYSTTTQVGKQQVSIVLLEGKIAKNSGLSQIWDDLTKLGQEMKAALDSILKLQPEDDVCVIGILVREPLAEFYTMRIHAEATYVMHRFAATYIASEAINVFPLVHLMEVFEHAKVKVEQTVDQIRRVKVHASPNPKVPLSWLRPSFKKPKLYRIVDGQ